MSETNENSHAVWDWWTKALANPREIGKSLPVHDGDAQQGYYRTRFKDKPWEPVAIWFEDGKWFAMRGEHQVDPSDIWSFACRNPITYEAYTKAIEGAGWDDDAPVLDLPPKTHNQSADPFEALTEEFAGEKELAEPFLKTKITTQEQADKAAVWSKRIAAIAKKATDLHKVEKQPSLDESRRIDDKWRDLKEGPADLSKKLKRHMDEFLLEQQRIENERRRKAQEEADRIRREAEAAARAAEEAENAEAKAEAARLAKAAADAEREAHAKNAAAGRTGAKVALRTFVSARVNDYQAAATALVLMKHPDMLAMIDQLANRAIKDNRPLPGVERIEEQRAA